MNDFSTKITWSEGSQKCYELIFTDIHYTTEVDDFIQNEVTETYDEVARDNCCEASLDNNGEVDEELKLACNTETTIEPDDTLIWDDATGECSKFTNTLIKYFRPNGEG